MGRLVGLVILAGIGAVLLWRWLIDSPRGSKRRRVHPLEPDGPVPDLPPGAERFRIGWNPAETIDRWPTVLPLAEMCSAVYLPDAEASEAIRAHGFTNVYPIRSPFHSQVACVAVAGDVAVVIVRGTDDGEDWFRNVTCYARDLELGEFRGEIHMGFAGAYSMLRAEIRSILDSVKPRHLWLTGHSLGGAVAAVCGLDLEVLTGRTASGIVTFGQPRVVSPPLGKLLDDRFGDRYVRFVNERDLVPRLPRPLTHAGLQLRFVGQEIERHRTVFQMTMRGTVGSSSNTEHSPEPIDTADGLPPVTEEELKQFELAYRGGKTEPPLSMSSEDRADPTPPVTVYGWTPSVVEDHFMENYLTKLKTAVERLRNSSN